MNGGGGPVIVLDSEHLSDGDCLSPDDDADGWYTARCTCGWVMSPLPDAETVCDALMQHAAAVVAEERDAARDLAFRAAFAPQEGAHVEFGAEYPDSGLVWAPPSAAMAAEAASRGAQQVARVVGPWKPVTP